jgi:hypothetical protein
MKTGLLPSSDDGNKLSRTLQNQTKTMTKQATTVPGTV